MKAQSEIVAPQKRKLRVKRTTLSVLLHMLIISKWQNWVPFYHTYDVLLVIKGVPRLWSNQLTIGKADLH